MKKFIVVLIAFISIGILGWIVLGNQTVKTNSALKVQSQNQNSITESELNLKMNMRKLWEDHITWTRMYLLSVDSDDSSASASIAKRLLKNQEDIGNAFKPYYGVDAGNKLTELLKEHINGAVDVVTAVKNKDQNDFNSANANWYANGNEIADFLSNANPNWQNAQMRQMLKEHLDLLSNEAADILSGKTEESIADYDLVHDQALKMADEFSNGIVKQFPDQF